MILYTDIIAGDELFSDAFPIKKVKLDEEDYGVSCEVDCALITVKSGGDIDIGANPSTEEQEDAVEDGATQIINVVHSFRLKRTTFNNKKEYLTYLKGYVKSVVQKLEENGKGDHVEKFKTYASKLAAKITRDFKDYEFFTGDNMAVEGMIALLNYREDGVTPYFTFWRDGLKEEKI